MSAAASPLTIREIYERDMQRALQMRAEGVQTAVIARSLNLKRCTLQDRFERHDRKISEANAGLVRRSPAPVQTVVPEAAVEPVWNRARRLMAERLLRAGRNVPAIARQLTNDLPGAPVTTKDVFEEFRGERWPQLRESA